MESRVSSRRLIRPLLAVLLIGGAGLTSAAQAQTKP
ncbi:cytochrome C, partial [Bacillus sp. AFS075960]